MVVNRQYRKNASFGVSVGNTACESVSSAEREKLFFQTTKESEISGLPVPKLYRAKNTGLVSNKVGRKYFVTTAPLPDRSYSTTVREHDDKEFLDYAENKVMLSTFKNPIPNVIPGLTSDRSEKSEKTPSFSSSSYASFFPVHSKKQRKAATSEIQRPDEGHAAVGCQSYSASGSSTYLELHRVRPVASASDGFDGAKNRPASSRLFAAPYTNHSLKSQYALDFRSSRGSDSPHADPARQTREALRSLSRSLSSPELRKKLHPHMDIFGATRICGMDNGR